MTDPLENMKPRPIAPLATNIKDPLMPEATPSPKTPKYEKSYMEAPPLREIGYLESYLPMVDKSDELKLKEKSTYKLNTGLGAPTPDTEGIDIPFDDNAKLKIENKVVTENLFLSKARELPANKKKLKWPTDSLRHFLYDDGNDFDSNDKYQDPTWLGFEIVFISDESALFNFDNMTNVNTVSSFLDKYGGTDTIINNNIYQRKEIYERFIGQIKQYFATSTDSDKTVSFNKRHYIELVSGLDKLSNKFVDYEKDFIEIQINEDISLRTQYMIELYNNLIYDYRYKRTMIPENLLHFNMYIKLKDIRPIKIENPDYDADSNPDWEVFMDTIPEMGETYTLYRLYDCVFDFSESQTHEGTIQIGGWSQFNTSNMNNTKFKIKYKSISKEFQSNIINSAEIVQFNSHDLSKQTVDTSDNYLGALIGNNDYSYSKEVNVGEQIDSSSTDEEKKGKSKMGKLIGKIGNSDIVGKKVDDFKKLGDKTIKSVTNGVKGKFSEVRGALITDLKKTITDALPWDRLGNVYSTDFRQMSLENFGKELASEAIDTLIDPNELMELTDVKMKAPTIDGGFSKPKTAFSKKGFLGNVKKINNQTNNDNYDVDND